MSPPLPEETQASLLSVGMRVRKSVPEGYKTHKTLGLDENGLPLVSTAPAAVPPITRGDGYKQSGTRELMPFSGLHKTGGWMAQEAPDSSAPAALRGSSEEGLPGLSWSQNTMASTQNSLLPATSAATGFGVEADSKKRGYEEEMEEEMDAFFDDVDADEAAAPAVTRRPFAKLKGSSRKSGYRPSTASTAVPGDFEEAQFLAPMDVDER